MSGRSAVGSTRIGTMIRTRIRIDKDRDDDQDKDREGIGDATADGA